MADTTQQSGIEKTETHSIIEALLYSAEEPLTESHVELCLEKQVDLDKYIRELNQLYNEYKIPLVIQYIAKGYKILVSDKYNEVISRLYQRKGNVKLSSSALETLAIIAYKQPVTRIDIDAIRGVSSYLKTLLEKKLIEIKGRLDIPGRPLLYGTTNYFLEYFGLSNLSNLPRIKEIENIVKEKIEEEPDGTKT